MGTWTGTIRTADGRTLTSTDLVNRSYSASELAPNAEILVLATAAAWSPAAAKRVAQKARVVSTTNQGFNGIVVFLEFEDGDRISISRGAVRPTRKTRRSYASLAAEYGTDDNGTLHPAALEHLYA